MICSFRFVEINKNNKDFSISVEYAVFHFNENQDDNFAYKFLRVRISQSQVSSLLPVCCLHSYLQGWGLFGFALSRNQGFHLVNVKKNTPKC